MLTSQVNCLEETQTGHHEEAQGTCYGYMIVANGKLSKDDMKAELCIVVRSGINIKSQDLSIDLHFCENKAHIQILTPSGPHTIEIAQDPDLTIPGAYN